MAKATEKSTRKSLRKSAVKDSYSSGLELVPKRPTKGKVATMRDFAKIDFQAWTKEKGEELVPGADTMNTLGFWSRAAYAIMCRTKEQLVQSHSEMEHELVDNLMGGLADTGEKLKALAHMVETAYVRILASASAHSVAGGKFKGVHDMRKTKRTPRKA